MNINIVPIVDFITGLCTNTSDTIIKDPEHRLNSLIPFIGPIFLFIVLSSIHTFFFDLSLVNTQPSGYDVLIISKIQLVVYYQCCVLIG